MLQEQARLDAACPADRAGEGGKPWGEKGRRAPMKGPFHSLPEWPFPFFFVIMKTLLILE